ncbi:MAG: response regulator transcription factor [Anaerolineae bacterium]|nr:response regulator transcription factor [Anaerolineae bacterium]
MSLTVLIADDSILIRERLAALISEIDGVHLAGQAITVLETIALASQLKPDVIILDIHMPDGNGIDALQAIRLVTQAPVIMLTAFAYPQYRERCMQLGANYFLNKNQEFDQIARVLDEIKQKMDRATHSSVTCGGER